MDYIAAPNGPVTDVANEIRDNPGVLDEEESFIDAWSDRSQRPRPWPSQRSLHWRIENAFGTSHDIASDADFRARAGWALVLGG